MSRVDTFAALPIEPFLPEGPLFVEVDMGPPHADRRGAEVHIAWRSGAGVGESFHRLR